MTRLSLFFIALALGFCVSAEATPRTVRILHINDFHGFANPVVTTSAAPPLGGAAFLAGKVAELKADGNALFLAAGDLVQGDSWANLSQGRASIELMNLMGLDATCLGNHEFDFGMAALRQRISEARFPMLAANLSGMPEVPASSQFMRNGLKITVIGIVTDETPQSSHPRNTVGLKFSPPLETARKQIAAASPDTDLIILLTHLGHEVDRQLAESLCTGPTPVALPLVIVGGHSHTKVEKPVRIGACAVLQAWEHGKVLGLADVTVDNKKLVGINGRLVEIHPDQGRGDSKVQALVERYNTEVTTTLGRQVGSSQVDLVQQGVRQQETNFGDLIADIIRKETGAQAALINGGSIRTGIPKGIITARQVYASLPFNNYLVAVRMTGSQLLETLEHGVSGIENGEGRFPQVSGIRFSFDPLRPVGKRIVSVSLDGKPLELSQEYTVATLDFIAAGGDGYTAFGKAIRSSGDFSEVAGAMKSSRLVYNDPGRFLRDVVLETLGRIGSVNQVADGRVSKVN